MAKRRVMVIGGGLAGLAASMKLAELDVDVGLMSLAPVKRSHSACAQGGINSVNDVTRQLGEGFLGRRGVAEVVDRDPGAPLRESQRTSAPDAARRAGDEHLFPGKFHRPHSTGFRSGVQAERAFSAKKNRVAWNGRNSPAIDHIV